MSSDEFTTTRLPVSYCARCGYRLDAATGVRPGTRPHPGCVTVCGACACAHVFIEGLRLRPMTEDEVRELPEDLRETLVRAAIMVRTDPIKPGVDSLPITGRPGGA